MRIHVASLGSQSAVQELCIEQVVARIEAGA